MYLAAIRASGKGSGRPTNNSSSSSSSSREVGDLQTIVVVAQE